MNAVIYFSCSGNSKAVAEDLAERLSYPLYDTSAAQGLSFFSVAVVFPVHCQSYPAPMKNFFKGLQAKFVTLIATYGGVRFGNAIYEAAKIIKCEIVAAAYLPSRHTFCGNGGIKLVPEKVVTKINAPAPVEIPRLRKTPFAGFLPAFRSRLGVGLKKNENCVSCGICGGQCPAGAIKNGEISSKCIRCLKCAYNCPNGALTVKIRPVLKTYLKKTKCDKTVIYV